MQSNKIRFFRRKICIIEKYFVSLQSQTKLYNYGNSTNISNTLQDVYCID